MHAFKNYPCLTADGLFLLDKFFRTANLNCHIFETRWSKLIKFYIKIKSSSKMTLKKEFSKSIKKWTFGSLSNETIQIFVNFLKKVSWEIDSMEFLYLKITSISWLLVSIQKLVIEFNK